MYNKDQAVQIFFRNDFLFVFSALCLHLPMHYLLDYIFFTLF